MSNLNIKAVQQNSYDAIVVGSGMSGGWAAKELCEKGLKTLVLERGRQVKHVEDYPTMNKDPWDYEGRGWLTPDEAKDYPKQNRTSWVGADNKHFFVKDTEHPYNEVKRFDWIRGYQTGGRTFLWGRQVYRWSDLDFEANAKDGIAVDWPIRYKDIEPWYSYVEKVIGVSGEKLGLAHLPDSHFLKAMELNCLEEHARDKIKAKFPDRHLIIGRVAHVTEPGFNGRGVCQFRNRCSRGCPFGAYFSSVAVTLPLAEKTGKMTLRPHSIVHSLIYDEKTGKATGVRVIDEVTKESIEYFAKVIFLNASTVASTSILLNSTSNRFPKGLGNDSGELGHNMMDHHYYIGAIGKFDGFEDKYYKGRRPNGYYIPRFRNLNGRKEGNYLRGYGYQGSAYRKGWGEGVDSHEIGASFKDKLFKPGGWEMMMNGFGECLPYHENKMFLDQDRKDQWGLPTVTFDCEFKENELNMRKQILADAVEMLETAGIKDLTTFDYIGGVGKGIHEMGTARMGKDPKTSVLNGHNQVHAAPNIFVTDGACMTSSSCVNPSLTYMALTARAANFAVDEMKKGNL